MYRSAADIEGRESLAARFNIFGHKIGPWGKTVIATPECVIESSSDEDC